MQQKGHDALCEIDDAFIMDVFNHKGIKKYVKNMQLAVFKIIDINPPNTFRQSISVKQLHEDAIIVYELLHSKFAQTSKGMKQIVRTNPDPFSMRSIREEYMGHVQEPCVKGKPFFLLDYSILQIRLN